MSAPSDLPAGSGGIGGTPRPIEPKEPVFHVPRSGRPLRIAVLVSGSGTTLQNFINERDRGRLSIDIACVISSRKGAFALERARRAGIPVRVMSRKGYADDAAYGAAVVAVCEAFLAEVICMAGFLRYLPLPDRWLGRVLNIHPSLLPAFGGEQMWGDRVHRKVIEYGCRVTGCTVHIADNILDHGPILMQRTVPVLQDDTVETLRARVFHEECLAYPQAIRLLAEGRVRFDGRRALIGSPGSAVPRDGTP